MKLRGMPEVADIITLDTRTRVIFDLRDMTRRPLRGFQGSLISCYSIPAERARAHTHTHTTQTRNTQRTESSPPPPFLAAFLFSHRAARIANRRKICRAIEPSFSADFCEFRFSRGQLLATVLDRRRRFRRRFLPR